MSLILAVLFMALPACGSEDSPGPCVWDAAARGNHQGTSSIHIGETTIRFTP